MWKTVLKDTVVKENRVTFIFDYPEDWDDFVVDKNERMFSEYGFSLDQIPVSILNVQFVASAMVLNMFHDGVVEVDELDKTFYESIPGIIAGYKTLYPDRDIKITIVCNKIVDSSYPASDENIMAFTGGTDATSAVASHINEKLVLSNIWGGDITLDNVTRHEAHETYFKQFAVKNTALAQKHIFAGKRLWRKP